MTVGIYTLGCKVNQYESEAIAEKFAQNGFTVSSAETKCDIYIINTCTVTSESDRKARQFIRRAISHNPSAYVIVTGCMAQTQPEAAAAIRGVDAVVGNDRKMSVCDKAAELIASGVKPERAKIDVADVARAGFEPMCIRKFDRTRAYVKIEDGCESHCAYCEIPLARGNIRSKPKADIIEEVKALTEGGCREIVLTGIETGSWGKDLDDGSFADLLCDIDKIPGVGRIRLGSLDPAVMKPEFVQKISGLRSLAPHFHLSMQSGCTRVLGLMKRKYNAETALERMYAIRAAIPGVQFTTDMITGFPQETDADFAETLEFVKKAGFLMIHVFPYSRRKGTAADKMSGHIPEEIKRRRAAELSACEAEIRRGILDSAVGLGRPVEVLFETFENGYAIGHTPEFICVRVRSDHDLRSQIFEVRLLSHDGNVCEGEI